MRPILVAFAVLVASLAFTARPAPAASDPFVEIAPAYVKLVLALGEQEEGYVDAYYGPPEWQAEAHAAQRPLGNLRDDAYRLIKAVEAVDQRPLSDLQRKRRAFLLAHLRAVDFRILMLQGGKPTFRQEAAGLFGVHLRLKPLKAYDQILARIDRLVPGEGDLAERVDAFRDRYVIPHDRLDAVMRAGIAECKRRTEAHIALPADENFRLEFVTGKSWSGYNYYKGHGQSLIQVNTDLPIYISRAIDLGCHEGYPGHHVHNALLEDRLVRGQGFVEFEVYPLFSPLSLIAEGTANYGIDLAFPPQEKLKFEQEVLFPLAGLDPATAPAYEALGQATKDLGGARMTIAADYLDGKIDRETAIRLTQKYGLVSRARAEQSVRFAEQYRSYVINYGLGEEMARRHVRGRWRVMEEVLSQPTLPADLD
jgi:hypothetical protein